MSGDSRSPLRTLLGSGGVLVAGLLLQQVLGFGGRVIVARFLGAVDYGAVSLALKVAVAASILVVLGTDKGIGRYLPRYDDPGRRRGVLVSGFTVVLPLAVLTGGALVVLADPIARYAFGDPRVGPVLRVFGPVVPLAAFLRLTVGTIRGRKRSLPRVYIKQVALPVVRIVLVAGVVWVGLGAVGVAWAYLLAYGVAAALGVAYLLRRTSLVGDARPVSMYRELLVFSLPLLVSEVMTLVLANLDTFMLGYFASTAEVGVYNAVYPLARVLQTVLVGFNFVLMPVVSEFHSEGEPDEVRRIYRVATKWIGLSTLPLFLTFVTFSGPVIRWTFGPAYLAGALTLSVLAAGFLVNAVAGPGGNVLTAIGHSRSVMYVNLLAAGSNVVFNLVLVPRYSFFGAAVATVASYAVMNGAFLLLLYRRIDAHPFTAGLVRAGVVATAVWVGLAWLLRAGLGATLPAFLLTVGAFAPVYLVVVVRFGGLGEELVLLEAAEDRTGLDLDPVRRVVEAVSK